MALRNRLAALSIRQEAVWAVSLAYVILFATALIGRAQWLAYAAFLYVPVLFAWGRGIDFAEYGLFVTNRKTTLVTGVLPTLAIFGVFVGGYWVLVQNTELPLPWYPEYEGPWVDVLRFAAAQFLVVAIAEEFFYRGYLQDRLDRLWPARWRILGAELGWGWIAATGLFALGHLADGFNPVRLLTFFPGLWYGWCRARTGNVYAGVFAHGTSNLLIAYLQGQDIAS